MFVQITYNSCARTSITDQDIAEVIARSLPNNLMGAILILLSVAMGLTSYVYYDDWWFLHVLEGRSAQAAHIIDSPYIIR